MSSCRSFSVDYAVGGIVCAVISPWGSELRANLERRTHHLRSQEAARRAKFDPFTDAFGIGIRESQVQHPEILEQLVGGKINRLCRDCPELANPREKERRKGGIRWGARPVYQAGWRPRTQLVGSPNSVNASVTYLHEEEDSRAESQNVSIVASASAADTPAAVEIVADEKTAKKSSEIPT